MIPKAVDHHVGGGRNGPAIQIVVHHRDRDGTQREAAHRHLRGRTGLAVFHDGEGLADLLDDLGIEVLADAGDDVGENLRVAGRLAPRRTGALNIVGDEVDQRHARAAREETHPRAETDAQRRQYRRIVLAGAGVEVEDGFEVEKVDRVEDDIGLADDGIGVVRRQILPDRLDLRCRVDAQDLGFERLDLRPADIGEIVELAVEVVGIDRIAIDQYELLEAETRRTDGDAAADAAAGDQQAGFSDLGLGCRADIAAVAQDEGIVVEGGRHVRISSGWQIIDRFRTLRSTVVDYPDIGENG